MVEIIKLRITCVQGGRFLIDRNAIHDPILIAPSPSTFELYYPQLGQLVSEINHSLLVM